MVSEDSTCTVLLRARCVMMLLLLVADSKDRRCAVCGITFKSTCNMGRKQKNDFVPIITRKNPAACNTHPHQKAIFYLWKLPTWTCELDPTRQAIRRISRLCNPQNTHAPPRRDQGCQNTLSLLRTSAVVFCLASIGERRSRSLENCCWKGRGGSHRLGPC